MAANLHFLLLGQGNIPWMVHELIRKAEPDAGPPAAGDRRVNPR